MDEKGLSQRIMHTGVKYIDRNQSQLPSNIVRKGKISDVIVPTDKIEWKDSRSSSGGWNKLPLLPNYEEAYTPSGLESKVKAYIGKRLQILLPLKIEDVTNEYLFNFRINGAKINGVDVKTNGSHSAEIEKEQHQDKSQKVEVASVPQKPAYSGPSSSSDVVNRDGIYVAYANGIVRDTKTGLEWKVGPDKDTTWDEARSWVQSLDLDGGGWRMPTLDELQDLYKKGAGDRNMTPLLKTSGWWIWSGEIRGSSDGGLFHFFGYGDRIWNVRGNSGSGRAFAVRTLSDQ